MRGGSEIPKRNGCAKDAYFPKARDAEFPRKFGVGVPKFLGKMTRGYKFSRDSIFPVTPVSRGIMSLGILSRRQYFLRKICCFNVRGF